MAIPGHFHSPMLPTYQPPDYNQVVGKDATDRPITLENEKNFTDQFDISNEALKHLQNPSLYSHSLLRSLAGPLCGTTLFLSVFSLTWGLILSFGPVQMTVNGVEKIVDESLLLGPGLLGLTAYFVLSGIMCLTVFIWSYRRSPKQPRPFGFVFLVSLVPLAYAIYLFCHRVGCQSVKEGLFCGLICFGGVVLAALPITYSIAIMRGI